jgi:Protein of unknown function (DUF2630)
MKDQRLLNLIKKLDDEEEQLYAKSNLTEQDLNELHKIDIELDQFWDLLRQRRALREMGKNPEEARLRRREVVEKYKQ